MCSKIVPERRYSLFSGSFLSYSSFDHLWWVLAAYFVIRLLRSEAPRWWICIGATVGIGLMTKYTMSFFILGIAGGVLLTPARRWLKSPWLWFGVSIALLIVMPNLFWQAQHHFVSFDFLRSIHARDIRWGWTDYFLPRQFTENINLVTAPLVLTGLWYVFAHSEGSRYRPLGWMYLIPLVALLTANGRHYYLAPAYPMLLAAGSVSAERWFKSPPQSTAESIANSDLDYLCYRRDLRSRRHRTYRSGELALVAFRQWRKRQLPRRDRLVRNGRMRRQNQGYSTR